MASLDQIISHIGDNTIVEQGTSGDWSYRKYANGFAECFGYFAPTSGNGTQLGNLYYRTYTVNSNFPFAFTEKPTLLITPASAALGIVGDVTYSETQFTRYDTYRGNGGTVGSAVSVHVFGKWQ